MINVKFINNIIAILLILANTYFIYHVFIGSNGLIKTIELSKRHTELSSELKTLTDNLTTLQIKIDGLDQNKPDLDLLEEKLKELGYSYKNEKIIYIK